MTWTECFICRRATRRTVCLYGDPTKPYCPACCQTYGAPGGMYDLKGWPTVPWPPDGTVAA